jgi:hypothetical protein
MTIVDGGREGGGRVSDIIVLVCVADDWTVEVDAGGRQAVTPNANAGQRHGCFAFCAFFAGDVRAHTGAQSPERSPREVDFGNLAQKRYRHIAFSRQFRNLSLEQATPNANLQPPYFPLMV